VRAVLIAAKELAFAKTRLGRLAQRERELLAQAMFRDVLEAATNSRSAGMVAVVSSDRTLLELARRAGAMPIDERYPRGRNHIVPYGEIQRSERELDFICDQARSALALPAAQPTHLPDELLGGAVKVIKPTDLRNRIGMFMVEEYGLHIGSKVDAGKVQDMIEKFVSRELAAQLAPGWISKAREALELAIFCQTCQGSGIFTFQCPSCEDGGGHCTCVPETCMECDGRKWSASEPLMLLIRELLGDARLAEIEALPAPPDTAQRGKRNE